MIVLIIAVAIGLALYLVGNFMYEAELIIGGFLVGYFLGKAYPDNDIL